ncbi:STAS-like domain-containing protein [Achromobacter spanius]|uniref:STAS-like domain-containing protein n=1 Tax=Achromobacter spanius TaxID=217203 RepID=UPI003A8DC797
MGTIRVLEHVAQCYNSADGLVIHDVVLRALQGSEAVTVSFSGVDSVPSSFVNTALISLLQDVPFSTIKGRLKFVDTNSQINEMIRSRFAFEIEKRNRHAHPTH